MWACVRYATVNPMKKLPEVGIICDASLIDGRDTIAKDGYFHGRGEWQAVDVTTGELVVQSHVQRRSTINIAELCAIIDSLMYLHDLGDTTTPVYNDNQYAVAWAISANPNTKLPRNADTMGTHYDLEERIKWLRENKPPNKILWYNSKVFGDNPADFGRK